VGGRGRAWSARSTSHAATTGGLNPSAGALDDEDALKLGEDVNHLPQQMERLVMVNFVTPGSFAVRHAGPIGP
jgi:hypothetical protein